MDSNFIFLHMKNSHEEYRMRKKIESFVNLRTHFLVILLMIKLPASKNQKSKLSISFNKHEKHNVPHGSISWPKAFSEGGDKFNLTKHKGRNSNGEKE